MKKFMRVMRTMLYHELGISWPLNAEERALCRDAYRQHLEAAPGGRRGDFVASHYGRDGFTYAVCVNGDGGGVWLYRFCEPAVFVQHPGKIRV